MYVCIRTYVRMCVCACVCECARAHTHTHTHTHIVLRQATGETFAKFSHPDVLHTHVFYFYYLLFYFVGDRGDIRQGQPPCEGGGGE